MTHHYYYDEDEYNYLWRKLGIGAAALTLVVAFSFFAVQSFGRQPARGTVAAAVDPDRSTEPAPPSSTAQQNTSTTPTTTESSNAPSASTSTTASTTTSTTTSTTSLPTHSATPTTSVFSTPPATLPDGSAVPIVAVFDVDTITLAGVVPSQAAADRLATLAQANSKTPASIINLLSIDPSVPHGVGVRVVELTSSRFPEGSAEILIAHADELNRITAVMNALPNTTVLVVGHADQVGSPQNNFELSERRAAAVVSYLVGTGIAPSRLSSRAVGESDLLSLDSDRTSRALNRRTEFVIYGALVGA